MLFCAPHGFSGVPLGFSGRAVGLALMAWTPLPRSARQLQIEDRERQDALLPGKPSCCCRPHRLHRSCHAATTGGGLQVMWPHNCCRCEIAPAGAIVAVAAWLQPGQPQVACERMHRGCAVGLGSRHLLSPPMFCEPVADRGICHTNSPRPTLVLPTHRPSCCHRSHRPSHCLPRRLGRRLR